MILIIIMLIIMHLDCHHDHDDGDCHRDNVKERGASI